MTQIAQSPRFVPTTLPATQSSFAAYERVLPRMTTLADANLLTVSRDNHAIAGVVLRALADIKAQRPLIEKHFKAFDFDQIDCLEDFANAARQAQSAYGVSINTVDELVGLMPRAVQLRELLVLDATGLIKRGVLADKLLKELRGPNGYQNVAADLLLLVNYFKAAWDKCSERVSLQDRDEAQALGDHLFYLIHQREKAETRQLDAGLRRQQSYTLLVNAYEYVRVAFVFFVEKTGSVDEVAPSLFTYKKGAKKDGPTTDEGTEDRAPADGEVVAKGDGNTPAPTPVVQDEAGFVPAASSIPAGLRAPFPGLSRYPAPSADDALLGDLPCPAPRFTSARRPPSRPAAPCLRSSSPRITSSPTASSWV